MCVEQVISGRNLNIKSDDEGISSYWKKTLGSLKAPAALEALFSPLSDLETKKLATEIKSGEYSDIRSWSTNFCFSAGLSCGGMNQLSEMPRAFMRTLFGGWGMPNLHLDTYNMPDGGSYERPADVHSGDMFANQMPYRMPSGASNERPADVRSGDMFANPMPYQMPSDAANEMPASGMSNNEMHPNDMSQQVMIPNTVSSTEMHPTSMSNNVMPSSTMPNQWMPSSGMSDDVMTANDILSEKWAKYPSLRDNIFEKWHGSDRRGLSDNRMRPMSHHIPNMASPFESSWSERRTSNLKTEMWPSDKYMWFTEATLKRSHGISNGYQAPGYVIVDGQIEYGQKFLPRSLVNALGPLSHENLPKLLKKFNIPKSSLMALAMGFTIERLEASSLSLPGETITKILSAEDFADYFQSWMPIGKSASQVKPDSKQLEVLITTTSFPRDNQILLESPFRVVSAELKADTNTRYASCESMTFPSQIQLCRSSLETRVYQVKLESIAHKDQYIQTTAICYTNTSKWDPQSQAFKTTGTKPGKESLCTWASPNGYTFVVSKDA